MVRNIVGTLVEVGVGRMKPEKITEIIEARNRRAAGPIAPPEGLCLMWIKYD
jgi:tRNA pseudouridine38-40 synthase